MVGLEDFAFLYQHVLYWVNDNVGNGDGTEWIYEVWGKDSQLADHFASQWRKEVKYCADVIDDPDGTGWPVHQLALHRFLMNLSRDNLELYLGYVLKNTRV